MEKEEPELTKQLLTHPAHDTNPMETVESNIQELVVRESTGKKAVSTINEEEKQSEQSILEKY